MGEIDRGDRFFGGLELFIKKTMRLVAGYCWCDA